MRMFVRKSQARQLLHNKFVVFLGGSVQRSMYKDLVLLLQRDEYLTLPQLKSKGEFSFEQDVLVEGGRLGPMTNGTEYREVRQYRSSHHLLRFYFLTRIYSPYMESILEDFRQGLKPDFIIVSSCVWDITRYGPGCLEQYKQNLHKFLGQIKTTVGHDCLILWTLAMPLGKKIKGGFLVPEVSHLTSTLCYDIIEANFYGSRLADAYGLDVLDLHFHFRLSLQHRMPDGIHWDALAHRHVSSLLLLHAADAWRVDLHSFPSCPGRGLQGSRGDFGHQSTRPEWPHPRPLLSSDPLLRRSPQLPDYMQQSSATFGAHQFHSSLPVQLRPRAAGNSTFNRQHNNPSRPANLWLERQVHRRVRATCSQMDFRLRAGGCFSVRHHFQADDRYMRRRRPYFRTRPHSPRLPRETTRHRVNGWFPNLSEDLNATLRPIWAGQKQTQGVVDDQDGNME